MKLLFSTFVLGMVASSSAVISDIVEDAKAKDDAASKNRLRGLQSDKKATVIITLKEDKNTGIAKKCESKANGKGGSVKFVYSTVLNGCAVEVPTSAVKALAEDPEVELLEEDGAVYATDCTPEGDGCKVVNPIWSLDRVDQCTLPLDGNPFIKKPANNVRVYIADTGLNGNHVEFVGMLGPSSCRADYAGEGNPLFDGNGHGTHVAGTTVGLTYGVAYCNTSANGCELCPIKVLNSSGSGSYSGVIAGIDKTASDCQSLTGNPLNKKCVLNMSLGGGKSTQVNTAVNNAVAAGVTVVVAAGNENRDACNYSPASAENAITVGATTSAESTASYSNYGSCVDFWAPGSSIKAAWIGSNTATRTISGTSMASPNIAGQAAAILGEGSASSPAQVQTAMEQLSFLFGTYARLPQDFPTTTGCGASPPPPAPTTPTDSPPPPAPTPAGCTSYTQKSVCQENGCVWSGNPNTGSCGDGSGTPPTDSPPSPSPGGCTTCSGLGGGACKSCSNCSWGGNRGCNPV